MAQKIQKTNVCRLLDVAGIAYELIEYEVDEFQTQSGKTVRFHALVHSSIRIEFDGNEIEVDPCGKLGDKTFDDLQQVGYGIDVIELIDKVDRDAVFYDESGGGVTFSGGEPLMQTDFLIECLKECKRRNIQTCLDTAGTVRLNERQAEEIVSHTDIVLFDVKTADAEKFQQVVKGDFSIFAENFRRFAESQARLIVRIPVIPGFNDDENSIDGILTFLNAQQARVQEVSLLPFHRIGFDKYKRLKRQWLMGDTPNLDQKAIEPLKERFVSAGYRIFPS